MHITEAVYQYADTLPDIDSIALQVEENLGGEEYLDKNGPPCRIVTIPIGAAETDRSIEVGVRSLENNRSRQTVVAFSINHVGEDSNERRLAEVAEIVQSATQDMSFASTFYTEKYSREDGTIGNIRARLVGATALAMLRRRYPLSRRTPLIIGDVDMLRAGSGLLPRLAGALDTVPFAQAAVTLGCSQDLHAAGLLSPDISFPNMDKALYFYNRAILASEYAAHDQWNAMRLGDHLEVNGFDTTVSHWEGFDLQRRLFSHTNRDLTPKLSPATEAFAVLQQRRFYARMQSGHSILDSDSLATDFSTVDDICRGNTYENLHDISLEEADIIINALWELTGELGSQRTLGDSIVWWQFRKTYDTSLGRNPGVREQHLARSSAGDKEFRDAQAYARGLFARVKHDYEISREIGTHLHTP